MKLLVFGNSGSGKSTFALAAADKHKLVHLDLDSIVWEPGKMAAQRPETDVIAALELFIAENSEWVIEGCYGDLIEAALPYCSELIFLNPGLDACLANNRRRPWEPHKYASAAEQDAMLENLQNWVAGYYERDDAWSYQVHRAIFAAFNGTKRELR